MTILGLETHFTLKENGRPHQREISRNQSDNANIIADVTKYCIIFANLHFFMYYKDTPFEEEFKGKLLKQKCLMKPYLTQDGKIEFEKPVLIED